MQLDLYNTHRRATMNDNLLHCYVNRVKKRLKKNGQINYNWVSVFPDIKIGDTRKLKRRMMRWLDKGELPKEIRQ